MIIAESSKDVNPGTSIISRRNSAQKQIFHFSIEVFFDET